MVYRSYFNQSTILHDRPLLFSVSNFLSLDIIELHWFIYLVVNSTIILVFDDLSFFIQLLKALPVMQSQILTLLEFDVSFVDKNIDSVIFILFIHF